MYEMKIVHRDLKPDNVMLTADGQVKVTDFGTSRFVNEELLMTHEGTPYYQPPELLTNQQYGTNVDMWSAGVILFQLVTGR